MNVVFVLKYFYNAELKNYSNISALTKWKASYVTQYAISSSVKWFSAVWFQLKSNSLLVCTYFHH